MRDIRVGLRALGKHWGATAVAVFSLALGIGLNTTIFSYLNAVLLRPVAFDQADRLVSLFTTKAKGSVGGAFGGMLPVSYLNYCDFRDENRAHTDLAAFIVAPMNLTSVGGAEELSGFLVTGNFFRVLAVRPLAGRFFLPEEDGAPGAHPVVVLSQRFWETRFAGERSLIGRTIRVSGRDFTVVGVAPQRVQGVAAGVNFDVAVPMAMHAQILSGRQLEMFQRRRGLLLTTIGRLEPGVSRAEAQASYQAIAQRLEKEYPDHNQGRSVRLAKLADATMPPNLRQLLVAAGWLLMTIVGLVLAIACANVVNLLLARAVAREEEVAVRLAMGASRWQVFRQILIESLLLFLGGGMLGLVLGVWCSRLLWSLRPSFLPDGVLRLEPDGRVLAFGLGLALLAGLLSGLVPALRISRADFISLLRTRAATARPRRRSFSTRDLLVAGQVAFSIFALAMAALFVSSFSSALALDLGFATKGLSIVSFNVGAQGLDADAGQEFYRRTLERVRALSGVRSAAVAESPVLFNGGIQSRTFTVEGAETADQDTMAQVLAIGDGYLKTLQIDLLRGRDFTAADNAGSPKVAIVNRTMAEKFFPGGEALGRRFRFAGDEEPHQIVGIVEDVKVNTIGEDPLPVLYYPLSQHFSTPITLFTRAGADPAVALREVQREIKALDPNLPLTSAWTVSEVLANALWAPRMGALVLALMGTLALVLAMMGIYGVTLYTVALRRREVGVRISLGAGRRDVLTMFLRHTLSVVLLGLAGGLALAVLASRGIASLLYGVNGGHTVEWLGASLLLLLVALVATYLPAQRATRVDPMTILRGG